MQSDRKVNRPPSKPLMLFDGDCVFCCRWLARWKKKTGTSVDYLPFQNPAVATRFPEIPREQLESAVHLIAADGFIYSGAAAVFRSLAVAGRSRWLVHWYQRFRLFARFSESCYRFVARHRRFFSTIS